MAANIRVQQQDKLCLIGIERPQVRNAVDGPTARALHQAFLDFDANPALSVAILHGSHGHFCAGADLKALTEADRRNPLLGADETGSLASLAPMGATRLQLSKPVIAAIEGHAVAGGLELALWCDLRVAAEDAVFGVFCRRFGVPLIDGGSVRLPRLIGMSRALDMILTGRAVGADEALQMGLVNRIAPVGGALDAALVLAQQLAAFPQTCLRHDRQSAYEQWSLAADAALTNEFALGLKTLATGETSEGASRFQQGEGRHGQFND